MEDVILTRQQLTDMVQAENIQFPKQVKEQGGITVCDAIPVIIGFLETIPSPNIALKIAIGVIVALLKTYQNANCPS